MELSTLLGHSAQLLKIIKKSPQPSDKLASQYFRGKKYLGSHDRRFISEVTFATLRIYNLSEYCVNTTLKIISSENSDVITNRKPDEYFFEFSLIAATCILVDILDSGKSFLKLEGILPTSNLNEKLDDMLAHAFLNKFNISFDVSMKWFELIKKVYNELNKQTMYLLVNSKKDSRDLDVLQYRFAIPKWIMKIWLENKHLNFTLKESCDLAESLFEPAPLTVRVNSHIINRVDVLGELDKMNISCRQGKISNDAIIINKRVQLNELDIYKNGLIEVQDEGSQLISLILAPSINSKVLDACAGAGGKTLHIASIQKDCGRVYANDIEWKRLKALQQRSLRSGFRSIEIIPLSKAYKTNRKLYENYFNFFDYVLVDAPCSGTGAVRRMPMHKWRLTHELLARLAKNQQAILKEYSQFVKPGGILVYATCSLMPEENDEVIDVFLNNNPNFVPDSIWNVINENGIKILGIKEKDFKLRLLPSLYGCDGFFAARMKKEL